jgi:prophage antirepressor-like protein
LRFPSIRSKFGSVITLGAAELNADLSRCGLNGSPTKVLKTFENEEGRRKCTFITPEQLDGVINSAKEKGRARLAPKEQSGKKYKSDAAALRGWVADKIAEQERRNGSKGFKEQERQRDAQNAAEMLTDEQKHFYGLD